MIRLEDYRPVSLGDRDLFQDYFTRFPQRHTEYMFTAFVSWSHYTPAYYTVMDGNLLLMNRMHGVPQFRPPIGKRDTEALKEVLLLAKEEGGKRAVIAIDEPAKEWISCLRPDLNVRENRDFADYVYLARDLSELPGKPYLNQRNRLNRFKRRYSYSVERISRENIEEVDGFMKRWCRARECEEHEMLEEEEKAIMYCMEHFFELALSGIMIRIEGEIQALSVWERLNDDTAAIHFEKGMQEYEGIYPAINNEAAKILAGTYTYINRESDLGIPGLRTAKERLHPHHMERLYYIEKDDL